MTIKSKDPVRRSFASRSTGDDFGQYYPTKGHAVNAFDAELQAFDLCFNRDELTDFNGDEGRKTLDIVNEFGESVGRALITWYRMPSGNYEFVGYIT